MHGHFVGVIATAALGERPSAKTHKDFVSKDLEKLIHLIVLFNN